MGQGFSVATSVATGTQLVFRGGILADRARNIATGRDTYLQAAIPRYAMSRRSVNTSSSVTASEIGNNLPRSCG